MTRDQLIAWAHEQTGTVGQPTEAEGLLAHYVAHLERGYSSAFMRDAMRLALVEQAELTPMGLDTAPPLDLTEPPVNVLPETRNV